MHHWLAHFCSWLQFTHLSQFLQSIDWIVPLVQTVHILAIGAVIAAIFLVTLSALGVLRAEERWAGGGTRFLPVIWWALPVLLISGVVLIIAEPTRSLRSSAFQLKMLLLIGAIFVTVRHRAGLVRAQKRPAGGARFGTAVRALLAASLWVGVIFAGRWIAYAPGR
jgi:hypothetical protein